MKDFEEILNEGSLENALIKINELSEESAILPEEDAWSVLYLLENRFTIAWCFITVYFICWVFYLVTGVHREM